MSPMTTRPMTIELALLGYLRRGPLHGYQIHQRLKEPDGLGRVWVMKQAHLYAIMEKLVAAGYITASIQPQETRPARRVFQLTPDGQAAFNAWITSPVGRPRDMRQEFQAKLYFAQFESQETCAQLIDAQRQACLKWLNSHTFSTTQAGDAAFPRLIDQYRVGQIQAMLDWLDQCMEALK